MSASPALPTSSQTMKSDINAQVHHCSDIIGVARFYKLNCVYTLITVVSTHTHSAPFLHVVAACSPPGTAGIPSCLFRCGMTICR